MLEVPKPNSAKEIERNNRSEHLAEATPQKEEPQALSEEQKREVHRRTAELSQKIEGNDLPALEAIISKADKEIPILVSAVNILKQTSPAHEPDSLSKKGGSFSSRIGTLISDLIVFLKSLFHSETTKNNQKTENVGDSSQSKVETSATHMQGNQPTNELERAAHRVPSNGIEFGNEGKIVQNSSPSQNRLSDSEKTKNVIAHQHLQEIVKDLPYTYETSGLWFFDNPADRRSLRCDLFARESEGAKMSYAVQTAFRQEFGGDFDIVMTEDLTRIKNFALCPLLGVARDKNFPEWFAKITAGYVGKTIDKPTLMAIHNAILEEIRKRYDTPLVHEVEKTPFGFSIYPENHCLLAYRNMDNGLFININASGDRKTITAIEIVEFHSNDGDGAREMNDSFRSEIQDFQNKPLNGTTLNALHHAILMAQSSFHKKIQALSEELRKNNIRVKMNRTSLELILDNHWNVIFYLKMGKPPDRSLEFESIRKKWGLESQEEEIDPGKLNTKVSAGIIMEVLKNQTRDATKVPKNNLS
ncbi:MAG: hypothetical protein V1926_00215 [Candidatus Peregrinibacteria bacterium]